MYCTYDVVRVKESHSLSLLHIVGGTLGMLQLLVLAICSAALHRGQTVANYAAQQGLDSPVLDVCI